MKFAVVIGTGIQRDKKFVFIVELLFFNKFFEAEIKISLLLSWNCEV